MSGELRTRIEAGDLHFLDGLVLLGTIASQRWFGGKSRDVLDARVLDAGIAPGGPPILAFAIVEVRYGLQSHDLYHLPLGFRPADEGWNESVIAEVDGWTVYDAIADPTLVRELVGLMRAGATLRRDDAAIAFWGADGLADRAGELASIRPMGAEQSNSSVVLDERLALKLYRRIEPGVNPELELLRFLTDRASSTSPRSRATQPTRGGRSRRRSPCSSASSPRRATAGSWPSTRPPRSRSGYPRVRAGSAR